MGNLFYRDKNQENDVGVNSPLPVRQFPDKSVLTFSIASLADGTSSVSSFDLAHSVKFTFEPRIFSLLTTFSGTAANLIGGVFIRKENNTSGLPLSSWRMLFTFTGSSSPSMAIPGGPNINRNYQSVGDIIILESLSVDECFRIGIGYRANGSTITNITCDFQVRGF